MVQLHVYALLLNNVQIICKKKIYIYGFKRALCHGNVENGMSPEKILLFETSLWDTNTRYNSNNYISWLDIVHLN